MLSFISFSDRTALIKLTLGDEKPKLRDGEKDINPRKNVVSRWNCISGDLSRKARLTYLAIACRSGSKRVVKSQHFGN